MWELARSTLQDVRRLAVELRPHGDGIGLVGMRERVELLGGRLAIESRPGAGTTFVAEVPLP